MLDRLLTIRETAELLGAGVSTLRHWDDTGRLVAVRTPGGHRRYRLSNIESFQGLEISDENEDVTAVKSQVAWLPSEVRVLERVGKDLSIHELCKLVPRHTAIGIQQKRRRLGIYQSKKAISRRASQVRLEHDSSSHFKLDQSLTLDDFDNVHFQILIGSLLGDGCIKKNSGAENLREYVFYEGHGIKQIDYVEWKAKMIGDFLPKVVTRSSGRKELFTVSHPIFTRLREQCYASDGRKRYLPSYLSEGLDELGLLIWYLDDGGISARQWRITSKLFDRSDLLVTIGNLNESLDLNLYVREVLHRGEPCHIVVIPAEDRGRLSQVWNLLFDKYQIPPHMGKKIGRKKKTDGDH